MDDITPTSNPSQARYERARQRERVDEILGPEIVALLTRLDTRRELEAERGIKALMLAPNPGVCMALLRGERLPWNALRYAQLRRYGIKNQPPDGRLSLDDINDTRAPQ